MNIQNSLEYKIKPCPVLVLWTSKSVTHLSEQKSCLSRIIGFFLWCKYNLFWSNILNSIPSAFAYLNMQKIAYLKSNFLPNLIKFLHLINKFNKKNKTGLLPIKLNHLHWKITTELNNAMRLFKYFWIYK